jgi:hypothetical protein
LVTGWDKKTSLSKRNLSKDQDDKEIVKGKFRLLGLPVNQGDDLDLLTAQHLFGGEENLRAFRGDGTDGVLAH